jgi:hypothetical protein
MIGFRPMHWLSNKARRHKCRVPTGLYFTAAASSLSMRTAVTLYSGVFV